MRKQSRKVCKIIMVLMLLIATDLSLLLNCVQAADITKEKVYEIDYCEKVLKYKGIPRGSVYVVYEDEGAQYPAYCINPERIGVGETDSYNVDINGYITDVMLWRIITNGYPYKEPAQLGVANEKEAYLATKQAIYCYLDNRDVNEYSGIGEAGERTLRALKQIWNNAQKSTETKISNVVDIISENSEWKQDEQNPEYISKTYRIEAPAPIVNYDITIKGENIPEGIIMADINNDIKNNFMPFEPFKILIPISSLQSEGGFEIDLETKMDTKPVLFGVSPSSDLQNYALTTFTYEDSKGTFIENYPKNEAQIKILKREKDTKNPLEGVEFQLLNAEKEPIYQSLITDSNGEITIKDIAPGTYYLQEVRGLQGYVLYDQEIKIDIHLNEQVNVIVNNTKEKNIEISKEVTNIEVEKSEENIEEKLKETNIQKEVNIQQETSIQKEVNIQQETNIHQEINEKDIQRLPKTGM